MKNLQYQGAKDKFKIGKIILSMNENFKGDFILRKMILKEFADNKLNKTALEYQRRDDDEQDMMKFNKTSGIIKDWRLNQGFKQLNLKDI